MFSTWAPIIGHIVAGTMHGGPLGRGASHPLHGADVQLRVDTGDSGWLAFCKATHWVFDRFAGCSRSIESSMVGRSRPRGARRWPQNSASPIIPKARCRVICQDLEGQTQFDAPGLFQPGLVKSASDAEVEGSIKEADDLHEEDKGEQPCDGDVFNYPRPGLLTDARQGEIEYFSETGVSDIVPIEGCLRNIGKQINSLYEYYRWT